MTLLEIAKKFFYEYPKNVVYYTKNIQEISSLLKKANQKPEWYFSSEAKKVYESFSSLPQKINFFVKYLSSVAKKPDPKVYLNYLQSTNKLHDTQEYIYRIAFVMANSMVDSNLGFGGYPNVLDEAKNPLVKYIKNNDFLSYTILDFDIFCGKILCVLHNGNDEQYELYIYEDRPFNRISYCKTGEPLTDMYKIERDIISVFSVDNGKTTFVPYIYNYPTNSDNNIEIDEEFEDEFDDE